jgi:hypothetical protein
MVGDVAELHRLAHRVRAEADEVRAVATQVAATAGVAWRSPAADLFRQRVDERVAALRRVAGLVEEAADLLLAHVRAVVATAAVLGRAADLARDAVERTGDGRHD